MTKTSIAENLNAVHARIADEARAAGRDPAEITLIAVSKTQPVAAIREALDAGQRDFGENYVQEAVAKIVELARVASTRPVWHYVGAIQSNKTRELAIHFDWIHTLDRERIARRLAAQCPAGKVLNVCLQINVDEDPNKAGIAPDQAADLLSACGRHPQLKLRGLMTILDPQSRPAESYGRLAELFRALGSGAGPDWDTLSMGMSGDYPAAIHAGATLVRVGTAIFGPRKNRSL